MLSLVVAVLVGANLGVLGAVLAQSVARRHAAAPAHVRNPRRAASMDRHPSMWGCGGRP